MQRRDGRTFGRGWCVALLACCLAACERGAEAADPMEAEVEAEVEAEPLSVAVPAEALAALPPGVTAEQARRGRALFDVCATCHALDAAGTQLGPDLRDGEWIHGDGSPAAIAATIRAGVPEPRDFGVPMPPMGGGAFAPDEVEALAAYVHLLSRRPAAP